MYKIIGIDQKEYGPVSAEEVRQWIRESRVNAFTRARLEESVEWRALRLFPEFADLLAAPAYAPPAPPQHPPHPVYPPRLGNGAANAGLFISLLSLACCAFPPFPLIALIFSCVGLAKALRNPLRGGKGAALAGIIISVLELLVWIIIFALGMVDSSFNFNYSP